MDTPRGHLDQLAAPRGHFVPRLLPPVPPGRGARHPRHHAVRTGPPERPQRELRAHCPRDAANGGRQPQADRPPRDPDQRELDARSRPRVRAAPAPRPHRDGRRRLGLQRLGRQVPALGCRRCGADEGGGGTRPAGLQRRHRDGRRGGGLQRRGDGAHHHLLPAEPEPEPRAVQGRDRAVPEGLLRAAPRDLAGRGDRGRRHRRARGRPGALRRRADDRDSGGARPAGCELQGAGREQAAARAGA